MKMRASVIGFLILGAICAAIGWFVWRSGAQERETRVFVTDAANAIARSWDASQFMSLADPGFIKAIDSQGQSVMQLFAVYSAIGKQSKPMECVFKDSAATGAGDDAYATVSYDCQGEFETGPATMLLTLRRKSAQESWKIYYIKVASAVFEKH